MGVFRADGTRITKAAFPATPAPDAPLEVNEDLYRTESYGRFDPQAEGSIKTLLFRSGTVIRQRTIDDLFPAAVVSGFTPANGPAAGGTVVTITGEDLDGVTGVTFGGTAGTALTVVSAKEIRVTSPAKVAGGHAVSVVDDAGTVAAGTFTVA